MTEPHLIPPDGTEWSIDTVPQADGVTLVVSFQLQGAPITVHFDMNRADARTLSDGILKASGDGMQRTFPHPPAAGGDHG